MRAVQCGMEIQTELSEYDSGEGFVLTLHVGVGTGKMKSLYIGGIDGNWEFLVVGEPFLQVLRCTVGLLASVILSCDVTLPVAFVSCVHQ